MKSPVKKLNLGEREYLKELLHDQLMQQTMSMEQIRNVGIDNSGMLYELGGTNHGILLEESGIPRIISEEQIRFLDCGHAIASPSQLLGKCDNGHLLCNMHGHNLMRCVKCGKLLCDICAVIDSEGNPRCHDHGHSVIGLIIIAVVLLIICLIACC